VLQEIPGGHTARGQAPCRADRGRVDVPSTLSLFPPPQLSRVLYGGAVVLLNHNLPGRLGLRSIRQLPERAGTTCHYIEG